MAVHTFGIGTLAYYDSMRSGLVPCKVTEIRQTRHGVQVYAVVTATRYAYPKGDQITSSTHFIIPRAHVRRPRGMDTRIIGGYEWA